MSKLFSGRVFKVQFVKMGHTIVTHAMLGALLVLVFSIELRAQEPNYSYDLSQSNKNSDVIRVQVTTDQQMEVVSRIEGQIVTVNFLDGELFKKDDVLLTFDCRELEAKLNQASARAHLHTEKFLSFKELYDLGGASKVELDVLESEMKEAQASLDLSQLYVDHCTIKAPFSGIVSQLDIRPYQTVSRNTSLMVITNNEELQLEMLIPSGWMKHVTKGTAFAFNVDDIGRRYAATIERIGGNFDPVTQTVKVYGELNAPTDELRTGMTGTAIFDIPTTLAQ